MFEDFKEKIREQNNRNIDKKEPISLSTEVLEKLKSSKE